MRLGQIWQDAHRKSHRVRVEVPYYDRLLLDPLLALLVPEIDVL